jgi:hypothetical protein
MQVSWIDPESLGPHLAALQKPLPQGGNLSHLTPGPALEALVAGLTSPPPATAAPPAAAPAKQPAPTTAEPGTVPQEVLASLRAKLDQLKSAGAPAPLSIDPHAPLGRRLGDFAAWVRRLPAVEEVLVLDAEGHLLWGPPQPAELVLAALMAMNAGRRNSARDVFAPPQRRTTSLGGGRELSLLPCASRAGCVQLALVQRTPLSAGTEAALTAGLVATIDAAP